MKQMQLDAVEPPAHRVRALAGVLAGFAYPGRRSFEKLTIEQKSLTTGAAREALAALGVTS